MSQERKNQEVARLLLYRCSFCQREYGEDCSVCPYDNEPLQSQELTAPPLPSQYQCLAVLGKGGMGVIFKARQLLLDKIVAIKMLNPEHTTALGIQRFQREGRAAAVLNHRNIASVQDFGVLEDKQLYMVMDYIEGPSLEALLRQRTVLPVHEALDLFIGVCDGLACAHKNGILHRDLKPSNIMLERQESGNFIAKLVDFGIAKLLEADVAPNLTRTGEIVGSPTYMSPEQAQVKELDERSDLYSLGCVMYETLTGRPPFVANNSVDVLFKHIYAKPISLHDAALGKIEMPMELEYIVGKLLSKSPSERFSSAEELRSHLFELQNKLYALAPHETKVVTARQAKKTVAPYSVLKVAIVLTIVSCAFLVASYLLHDSSLERISSGQDTWVEKKNLSEPEKAEEKAADSKVADAVRHGIEHQQTSLTIQKDDPIPWKDIAANGALKHLTLETNITDHDLQRLKGQAKLEELDLTKSKHVTDAGLSYLGDLTRLKKLSLCFDKQITGAGFNSFTMSPVSVLNLDSTNLDDEGCASLSRMPCLETLYVGQTKITDIGLRYLSHLQKLTTLYMPDTAVADLGGIGPMSKLAHLAANHTKLTDQGMRQISNLKGLQSLYLIKVNVSPKALSLIGNLPLLSDLDLSFDRIDASSITAASKCHLKSLNLSGCPLDYQILTALTRCKSLGTLDLSHAHISSLDFVNQLPNLKKLSLVNGDFSPHLLQVLVNNRSITHLFLGKTEVCLTDLNPITQMPNLQALDLRDCPQLSASDIESLKEKLYKNRGRIVNVVTTSKQFSRLTRSRRSRHHR